SASNGSSNVDMLLRPFVTPARQTWCPPCQVKISSLPGRFLCSRAPKTMHVLCRFACYLGSNRQALLDRQRRITRPLVPGTKIHPHILHARVLECEERVRGARALEAIEIDWRVLADADRCTFGQNLVLGLEARAFGGRLHHAVPFQPDRTGN